MHTKSIIVNERELYVFVFKESSDHETASRIDRDVAARLLGASPALTVEAMREQRRRHQMHVQNLAFRLEIVTTSFVTKTTTPNNIFIFYDLTY